MRYDGYTFRSYTHDATDPASLANDTLRTVYTDPAGTLWVGTFDGLDRLDRAVLDALCRRFAGGPVGLSTLAVSVGEETDTVETVAEPYLVRQGYVVRSPRGRMATPAAWQHLGLTPPPGEQSPLPLSDGSDSGRLG